MKNAVIKSVNFMVYLAMLAIVLVGLVMALAMGDPLMGAAVAVGGWFAAAFVAGAWFALSTIASNSEKQRILLENIYAELQSER
jgi:hypothetical protein